VKKARKWLDGRGIDYRFHDFRVDGLSEDDLQEWLDELGWETLLNKRSTTWKQLDPAVRTGMDASAAKAAILEHPTLIKRPLLDTGHTISTGFSESSYEKIFTQHTL
jgi:Spx/MgsR family transcriptional regulator